MIGKMRISRIRQIPSVPLANRFSITSIPSDAVPAV
jgi:hypothetical protein